MEDDIDVNDEKYEEALGFLRDHDETEGGGSYFEEVATVIEELLFRVHELQEEAKPKKRPTKEEREAAAIEKVRQANARAFYSTRDYASQTHRLPRTEKSEKPTHPKARKPRSESTKSSG